ncbi:MAG: hypothetical protein N4A74_12610 [Carboxylicivirga sp.]|nr:hypothetical protein [Carboxylicivirga sp.]
MISTLLQKFYVPDEGDFRLSGNFTLPGLILAAGLSALVSILSAYLYALLVAFIPFIYLNAMITGVFGIVIGFTVIYISRITLIRNAKVRFTIGVVSGIIGVLAQWLVFLFFLVTGEIPLQDTIQQGVFLLDPVILKDLLSELYNYGTWSIFGVTLRGIPLLLIWLAEAVIIIGAPLLLLLKYPISPFSEKLNQWYPKKVLAQDFAYVSGVVSYIKELRDSKAENLLHYPRGDGHRHSRVSIYFMEQEEIAYLSTDNIYITSGDKGGKDIDPVVRFVAIPNQVAKQLLDKFGVRKWSYQDMLH